MNNNDYIWTKSTCTECFKEYRYQYHLLDQLSANEDTLYCPYCHKRVRYSRWLRYGATEQIRGDTDEVDNN